MTDRAIEKAKWRKGAAHADQAALNLLLALLEERQCGSYPFPSRIQQRKKECQKSTCAAMARFVEDDPPNA